MFKKILLVAAIGVGACFALKNTRAGAYLKGEVSDAMTWADSKIPAEKRVAMLRKDIKNLDKEVDKASSALAKEIVEVDYLTRDIEKETVAIAGEEKKVRAVAEAISAASDKFISYGRQNVSAAQAKQLLADDVKRIRTRKETLASMSQKLANRELIKDSIQKQVEALKNQKSELSMAVERLDADVKALQLAQMESKYQFDDTKLSKVKKDLAELQKEIDIKRTKLKIAPIIAGEAVAPSTGLTVEEILADLDKSEK